MDHFEDFFDFCKYQRNLSMNTIKSYGWDLKEYFQWLEDGRLGLAEVQIKDIDAFIAHLRRDRENAISSVNRKLYCLKQFYKYLRRINFMEKNPLEFFQNIRGAKTLPYYLKETQQKALLKVSRTLNHRPYRNNWMRKRDYLMILFFLDTGLRVSEVCNIEIKDLNLDDGILRVIGKAGRERETILSNRLIKETKEYLNLVNQIKLNKTVGPGLPARGTNLKAVGEMMGISYNVLLQAVSNHSNGRLKQLRAFVDEKVRPLPMKYLFFNQQGQPMDPRHVFRIVKEIGEKAGIENLYPHLLRHTFATNLRREGADLLLIKEALGHSSVSTTQIYAHLGSKEFRTKMREFINS